MRVDYENAKLLPYIETNIPLVSWNPYDIFDFHRLFAVAVAFDLEVAYLCSFEDELTWTYRRKRNFGVFPSIRFSSWGSKVYGTFDGWTNTIRFNFTPTKLKIFQYRSSLSDEESVIGLLNSTLLHEDTHWGENHRKGCSHGDDDESLADWEIAISGLDLPRLAKYRDWFVNWKEGE